MLLAELAYQTVSLLIDEGVTACYLFIQPDREMYLFP